MNPQVEDLKPLQLQCVIAIRDGIENGLIRSPHLLPPTLRQYVLNIVLTHGTITNPSCLVALSSAEFLKDCKTLNTQRGNVDDSRYLKVVTESMTTIGEEFRGLKLNVYGCPVCASSMDDREATTLTTVLQLIAMCSNLESLSLRSVTHMGKLDRCQHESKCIPRVGAVPAFLNDLASEIAAGESATILENLKELHLAGTAGRSVFLRGSQPMIRFRRLSSLTLVNCDIEASAWAEFVGQVQSTLTSLVLERVDIIDDHNMKLYEMRSALTFALPCLEQLVLDDHYRIDQDCIDKLIGCSNLERVHLSMDSKSDLNQQSLSNLASFLSNHDSTVGLYYYIRNDDQSMIDYESHFALVKTFDKFVTSFEFLASEWNQRVAIAFSHAMATCQNLKSLEIGISDLFDLQQMDEIESAVLQLFDNEERALGLHSLSLKGEFSGAFLTSVVKNCSNLKKLTIGQCALLNDAHRIDLASSGCRLSELNLPFGCENISPDEGLLPVLTSGAERLRRFECYWDLSERLGDRFWRDVFDQCRFLEEVADCPKEFEELMKEKCHNMMHQMGYVWRYKH